jgi:methionyl-tRNA formyltransferase
LPEIVFMGTPEFAVPALAGLLQAGHHIRRLVCQPDRKKGRGQKLQAPSTKQFALAHGIEVYQPSSLKTPDVVEKLAADRADFFIVIAYGRILPPKVLALPAKGCINVHASLLPKWRGAAPIQFALLNGDDRTGVCTMLLDEGMDTGDLLLSAETAIEPQVCAGELTQRLARMGADLLIETLDRFDAIEPQPQDHAQATYTRLLDKADRLIDWQAPAAAVYGRYRALTPEPGVLTHFRGRQLVLRQLALLSRTGTSSQPPGTVLGFEDAMLRVACGQGEIGILSAQPQNRKPATAGDLVNGYRIAAGEVFGGGPQR